jgi:hypothetical protein
MRPPAKILRGKRSIPADSKDFSFFLNQNKKGKRKEIAAVLW